MSLALWSLARVLTKRDVRIGSILSAGMIMQMFSLKTPQEPPLDIQRSQLNVQRLVVVLLGLTPNAPTRLSMLTAYRMRRLSLK